MINMIKIKPNVEMVLSIQVLIVLQTLAPIITLTVDWFSAKQSQLIYMVH